jgi:hypothetical protein
MPDRNPTLTLFSFFVSKLNVFSLLERSQQAFSANYLKKQLRLKNKIISHTAAKFFGRIKGGIRFLALKRNEVKNI